MQKEEWHVRLRVASIPASSAFRIAHRRVVDSSRSVFVDVMSCHAASEIAGTYLLVGFQIQLCVTHQGCPRKRQEVDCDVKDTPQVQTICQFLHLSL